MIVVVMLCAVVFYAVLYVAWETSQTRLTGAESWVRALDHAIWMPENLVFIIFRGLIIACMFYVIGDWMVSSAKRLKRYSEDRREKNARKIPKRNWAGKSRHNRFLNCNDNRPRTIVRGLLSWEQNA